MTPERGTPLYETIPPGRKGGREVWKSGAGDYFLFAASTIAWTLVGRPKRVMKPAESFWS